MILRGATYRTRAGKRKRNGRDDWLRLEPSTPDEAQRLDAAQRAGRIVSHQGSDAWTKARQTLRDTARAIDPRYQETIEIVET
ncbi:MAG: hypothetical protein EHM24_29065 [Acidobacteria bacterium]|nr:MAG: hypothetical protein EHM24_29065 [Acidobacteriota bacterium]